MVLSSSLLTFFVAQTRIKFQIAGASAIEDLTSSLRQPVITTRSSQGMRDIGELLLVKEVELTAHSFNLASLVSFGYSADS